MPDFDSWEALCAAVDNSVKDILLNDVAPVAEEILRKHIEKDIYGAYSPHNGGFFAGRMFDTPYSRRHVLEGGIKSEMESKDSMMVTSYADANQSLIPGYHFASSYPGAFLQLLESGNMGCWKKGFARPAVANTQKEIDSSPKIERAIKKGIKRVFS